MTRRATVQDAARTLGLTVDAIRKRIERGTIPYERDEGRVWILLDEEQDATGHQQDTGMPDVVEVLRDEVVNLREQLAAEREANRENRRIIAGLVNRVPELEASPAERTRTAPSQQDPVEGYGSTGTPGGPETASSTERRSWWRRVIGR